MKTWFRSHLLTLAFLATSQAWVLQTNHVLVTPGSTTDVELICRQGDAPEAAGEVNRISSIRITKEGPFWSKTTFVEVHAGHDKRAAEERDVTVTGEIKQDEGASFLKVKWKKANHDTPAAYGCEIDALDMNGHSGVIHAKPIVIKEKFMTAEDVKDIILSVISGFKGKQQALELEIAHLKTFIENELNAKGRQISDIEKTLTSAVSVIKENTKLKYATKTEVSFQISELRDFILHEIKSEGDNGSCSHRSTDFNLRNSTCERIDSVEQDIKSIDVKLDNVTDYFTEQVERMHLKIGLCCPDTFSTKEPPTYSYRPSTGYTITPPTTISPGVQVDRDKWPCGKYTMVRSRLGCPTSENGNLIFYTFPYTLWSDVDNIDSLFKVNLRSGYRITALQFCYRSTDSSSTTRWPKGSYCIGKSYSPCPDGFFKGERKQKIFETMNGVRRFIGIYKDVYCCRSDGLANVRIKLPTRDPFYMYRYKGKCQKVKGMNVEQDSIYIRKAVDVDTVLASTWTTPDMDSGGHVVLCHYFKS